MLEAPSPPPPRERAFARRTVFTGCIVALYLLSIGVYHYLGGTDRLPVSRSSPVLMTVDRSEEPSTLEPPTYTSPTTPQQQQQQIDGTAPDWWRPVYQQPESGTVNCVPSSVTGADERGGFVGVSRCETSNPRIDMMPKLTAEAAREVLFGHCRLLSDACPTFYPSGIELTKSYTVSMELFKVHRKPVVLPRVVSSQSIHATAPVTDDLGTYRFIVPNFTWWDTDGLHDAKRGQHAPPPSSPRASAVSFETVTYDVAVWLPTLTTCLNNLYHGTFEYVLPLWHLLAAVTSLNRSATAPRVLLIFPVVRLTNWGRGNSRCDVLNRAPYGFGPPSVVSYMLAAIRATVRRLDFVAVHEDRLRRWRLGEGSQEMNATFKANVLYRGLPASCFAYARSMEQVMTHGIDEYPYVRPDHRCDAILRGFVAAVLRNENVDHDPDRAVSLKEAACPHIVVISRAYRANGRGFLSEEGVADGVRAAVPSCGHVTIAALEKLTIADQLRLMRNTTVLVGARGAGVVMGLFLRRGAGLVTLSPYRPRVPLFFDDATQPWVPWGFIRDDLHVTAGLCRFVPPPLLNEVHYRLCTETSTNFCHIDCREGYVRNLTLIIAGRVEEAARSRPARQSKTDSSTWMTQVGTTYLVPVPVFQPSTEGNRQRALFASRMHRFAFTAHSITEPELPRNIKWLYDHYKKVVVVFDPFGGGSLLNAVTDEIIPFVAQPDATRGARYALVESTDRSQRLAFHRLTSSAEERILKLADGPNPAFSVVLLGREVKWRYLDKLRASKKG